MTDPDDLPYPPDEGRTHYDGCWRNRGHHNCAVAHADRLIAELRKTQPTGWTCVHDVFHDPQKPDHRCVVCLAREQSIELGKAKL